jgi:hypothetical protein
MNKNGMTEAAEKALRETLGRAIEFDQLVNMPGWKRIESYYANKVQQFTNDVLLSDKPLSDFESRRSEINGIRGLLNHISSDLEELKNERKAPRLTDE